jgi:hypothetical protein
MYIVVSAVCHSLSIESEGCLDTRRATLGERLVVPSSGSANVHMLWGCPFPVGRRSCGAVLPRHSKLGGCIIL